MKIESVSGAGLRRTRRGREHRGERALQREQAGAKLTVRLLGLCISAACAGGTDATQLSQPRGEARSLLPGVVEAVPDDPVSTPGAELVPTSSEPPSSGEMAGPSGPVGPPDSIYARSHVVQVRVEMDPADWEKLSFEGIGMGEILFPASGFRQVPTYTHFPARVTVDGVTYPDVDIRKKGYIGSLSVIRPSLKLDFERGLGGQELVAGNRRMTLNNDLQDPSHVRQCLSYDLFRQLGIPASRCSYAHVLVNGVDLGTYSHVEPVAKPMLRHYFDDVDGNLYEGQESDFNVATAPHLELETNEKENDRSDVQAVIDVLALPDDQVLAALEQKIDLERFFDFWALETLLGHWDGYSGNSNNYFLYHDPTSGKFTFIPWGTDQTFVGDNPNDNLPYEIAVYAAGTLASRLYALPDQRRRYRQRLSELLDTLWNVPELLERVNTLSAQAPNADGAGLARVKSYIRYHGETLRAALAQPAPEWPTLPPAAGPPDPCQGTFGELSGAFSTVWGSLSNNADVALNGSELLPGKAGVDGVSFEGGFRGRAGDDGFIPGNAGLKLFAPQGDGFYLFAELSLPLALFEPGYHPWHSFESYGQFGLYQPDFDAFIPIALIGDGGITLERASLEPGGAVRGSFTGKIDYFSCISRVKSFFPAPEEPPVEPPAAEAPPDGAEGPPTAAPPMESPPSE